MEIWTSLRFAAAAAAAVMTRPLGAVLHACARMISTRSDITGYDQVTTIRVKGARQLGWARADTQKRAQIITILSLGIPTTSAEAITARPPAAHAQPQSPDASGAA